MRLCRSSRAVVGDPLKYDVLSILDAAVLPALSYMDCNCCMAEEVYSLLKLYSYQCRSIPYSLLYEPHSNQINSLRPKMTDYR